MQDKQKEDGLFSVFMMGVAVGAIGALAFKNHKTHDQTKEFLNSLSSFIETKLNPGKNKLPPFDAANHPFPPV